MTAALCVITLSWLFVVLFVIVSATTTHNYFTPDTVSLATEFAAETVLTQEIMCSTGAGLVGSRVYWVIRLAENMSGFGLPLLCRSWSTFRFTYGG